MAKDGLGQEQRSDGRAARSRGPMLSRRDALAAGLGGSSVLLSALAFQGRVASAQSFGALTTAPGPTVPPPPPGGIGRLAGGVDVRDFGATGNGTTDDGPAVQRAIDVAQTEKIGLVVIPPGTYLVNETLEAQAPLRIVGLGGWSNTTLVFASDLANGILFEQGSSAVVYPGPAMQLANLGLQYAGSGNIVQLNESQLPSPFQDTLISGCRFYLQGAGTGILTVNQRDAIITGCQFLGSNARAAVGIALSDSDNTKVEDNVFYNLLYGVYGQRAANRVFDAGCVIIGNSMYGFVDAVHFEGWELVQAIGNIVDGASSRCFYLLDCYHSIVADNYLGINGTDYGLLIETQSPYGAGFLGQITVRGNYLNHYEGTSGSPAIGVVGASASLPEDQITIEGNIINGYPNSGAIYLHNAQNVMVSMNTLNRAAQSSTGVVSVLDDTPGLNYIFNNIVDAPVQAEGDYVVNNFTRAPYPT